MLINLKRLEATKIDFLRLSASALLLIFFLILWAQISLASEQAKFPAKAIKIVVPASAGGSLGQETRAIVPALEKQLGVSIMLDYVVGAEGMIAYNKFYKEKPDGYTILSLNQEAAIYLELAREEQAKFKVKDFTPLAGHNIKMFVLCCHADRWKSFDEFLREAKQKNLSITMVGGAGSLQGYLMESVAGLKINWVPYDSGAEAMAAVVGKHVDANFSLSVVTKPMINAGRLRALAVFNQNPDPNLPGAPTTKELGHDEIPSVSLRGIFAAPPKTPPKIVSILENAIKNACVNSDFKRMASNIGLVVDYKSTSDLNKLADQNYELLTKYKKFVK